MRCTVVLCPWRKRSILPRMMGTFSLPESGQTNKLFSKCCALERVVWRNLRWKKYKRLADRVHGSTKYRSTSAACHYTTHYERCPTLYRRFSFLRSFKRGGIRNDRHYKK